MASRPNRRRIWRLAAGLASVSLALTVAGVVNGHAGNPASIQVMQTGPLTVQASGSWSWAEMATASKLSYAGFAIDWGDVTTGNAVPKPGGGDYHIGDGTAATNVVMQPTSPSQGVSGTWGAVTHTYAQAGTYMVCVIVYDLGEVTPFKARGYHSLTAGGTDHNTDNSAEKNGAPSNNCISVDVGLADGKPVARSDRRGRYFQPIPGSDRRGRYFQPLPGSDRRGRYFQPLPGSDRRGRHECAVRYAARDIRAVVDQRATERRRPPVRAPAPVRRFRPVHGPRREAHQGGPPDRKSTRLNSSHANISYAVFCL